jgi:hypothetical protein
VSTVALGYVRSGRTWLVQVPDSSSRWGFYLADEDSSWDGGFGAPVATTSKRGASHGEWELVEDESKVPARVKARLGWILDETHIEVAS